MQGQFLGRRVRALRGHDEGAADLAPAVVGNADHRHLAHGGMFDQRGLDLDRIDVLAARDEHVLLAANDA